MTELLYLKDSYQKQFEAKATAVQGSKAELDKTCFYARGGGQPTDTGKLFSGEQEFVVGKVGKEKGITWHFLDKEGLKAGDNVRGEIDWGRRYKLMRMHTSAHVLSAVIFGETGNMITGNQLGLEQSRMDFDTTDYSPEFFRKIEQKANDEIEKRLDVKISFMPKEEAVKDEKLFRLKIDWRKDSKSIEMIKRLPQKLRIVSIGELDRQADGGTHVKNTQEIGGIKIVKTENKGAENRRIYWVLEETGQEK